MSPIAYVRRRVSFGNPLGSTRRAARRLLARLPVALIFAFSVPALSGLAADLIYGAQAAGIPLVQGPCRSSYPSNATQYNHAPYATYTYGAMNANGVPDGNNPWLTGNGTDNPPPDGRNASALTLDLFMPSGGCAPGGCPVVILFHGGNKVYAAGSYQQIEVGGINSGECPRLSYPSTLTGHGYACAAVWFPLTPNGVQNVNIFPAQLQAAVCALRYLKANATTLGVNGDKVVTWGESAGNYFGSMLASIGSPTIGPVPDPNIGALPVIKGVQQHYDNPGCLTPPTATNTQVLGSVDNYGFFDAVAYCNSYSTYFGSSVGCPPKGASIGITEAASPEYQATPSTPFQIILRGNNDAASTDAINAEWYNQTNALGIPSIYITLGTAQYPVGHGYTLLGGMSTTSIAWQPAICSTLTYMQSVLNP